MAGIHIPWPSIVVDMEHMENSDETQKRSTIDSGELDIIGHHAGCK